MDCSTKRQKKQCISEEKKEMDFFTLVSADVFLYVMQFLEIKQLCSAQTTSKRVQQFCIRALTTTKKIVFGNSKDKNKVFQRYCKQLRYIKSLDACTDDEEASLHEILNNNNYIDRLSFTRVSTKILKLIVQKRYKLTHFSLVSSFFCPPAEFYFHTLEVLRHCGHQLRSIHVTWTDHRDGNSILLANTISQSCQNIQDLSMSVLSLLKPQSVRSLARNCPKLVSLTIHRYDIPFFSMDRDCAKEFAGFKNLRALTLGQSNVIPVICRLLPNLEKVVITSPQDHGAMAAVGQYCTNLKVFVTKYDTNSANFDENWLKILKNGVQIFAFVNLFFGVPDARNVWGTLSNEGVILSNLRELHIPNCRITEDTCKQIAQCAPNLVVLDISGNVPDFSACLKYLGVLDLEQLGVSKVFGDKQDEAINHLSQRDMFPKLWNFFIPWEIFERCQKKLRKWKPRLVCKEIIVHVVGDL